MLSIREKPVWTRNLIAFNGQESPSDSVSMSSTSPKTLMLRTGLETEASNPHGSTTLGIIILASNWSAKLGRLTLLNQGLQIITSKQIKKRF